MNRNLSPPAQPAKFSIIVVATHSFYMYIYMDSFILSERSPLSLYVETMDERSERLAGVEDWI